MSSTCPLLDSNCSYIAFSNPNPNQVVTNAELLDPEPELIDPKSDDNTIELRKSGIVKRGPKSHKQGYSISTNEKLAEELQSRIRKIKFENLPLPGSIVIETSTESNLYDRSELDYYDYDKATSEPSLYSCKDSKNCTGKIETDHHYILKCWSCNK